MNRKEYVTMITTYPSKVTHTSFFTDADGDLILPDVLKLGNYRIEEVAAPHGYVVNKNHVTVAVDTDTFYEIDPETNEAIITVAYENEPTVGKLTVKKRGELLDAFKGGLFASSDKKEFVYVEGNLAGAKFEVYANEDIYTADMQLDVNGERTKYYSKDELVATIVTDKNGVATLKDLPLGSYRVVEVEAPYGYVLDSEEQVVTFVYVDDKTPVIEESVTFGNDRQKLEISLDKKDSENGNGIGGAVFGLYAGRDIVNAEGKVIVEAGTLLEKAVSDEHGHVLFVKDYPFSNYYVKEIQSPKGYVSSDETVIFETEYKGQDVEVASYNSVFLNVPTTFEFTKTDITSGAELTGATLTVFDSHMNSLNLEDSNGLIRMKAEFMFALCEQCYGEKLNRRQESIIDRCVRELYFGIARSAEKYVPIMSDFYELLLQCPEQEAKDLALALDIFVNGSLNIFNHHTNVDVDNRFTVFAFRDMGEKLAPPCMLIMMETIQKKIIENGEMGFATWLYIDEFHTLLNSEYTAKYLQQLWKKVRKQGGLCTGITQNIMDLLESVTATTMLSNSEFVVMLKQSNPDAKKMEEVLGVSDAQLRYVTNSPVGTGLLKCGSAIVPFDNEIGKDTEIYKVVNTNIYEKFEEAKKHEG